MHPPHFHCVLEGSFPSVAAAMQGDEGVNFVFVLFADGLSPPVNVTIKAVKANSAVVTWDIPEGDPVIGFAITQQVGGKPTRLALASAQLAAGSRAALVHADTVHDGSNPPHPSVGTACLVWDGCSQQPLWRGGGEIISCAHTHTHAYTLKCTKSEMYKPSVLC